MIVPDSETLQELAKHYNTVPLCKEIYADIATPITLCAGCRAKVKGFSCSRAWKARIGGPDTLSLASTRFSVSPAATARLR